MALLCGCTQTGAVAPQEPEKNPEALLLQQARDMIQSMTKANPMLTIPMSEEEKDAFDTMKEGLFDHPSAELYLYPNYVPLLDSLQEHCDPNQRLFGRADLSARERCSPALARNQQYCRDRLCRSRRRFTIQWLSADEME